ncbi:MAG: 23S rRNA (adenine(1618)-N(6))-methyltransferase RlmF [Cyclobacteriaceae bacterium]
MTNKSSRTAKKPTLHPRNKHTGRYDFDKLIACYEQLAEHVTLNIHQNRSIDFANPESVKALNRALLKLQYGIQNWDIPDGYLCPPIPGRADYIHYMADLLCSNNYGKIPTGEHVTCLDIGTGSSCIYPIIGSAEYGWSFIGSDIDKTALSASQKIIDQNNPLLAQVRLVHQAETSDIIYGVLTKEDRVDLSVCNPPFHASAEEARKGSLRKVKNLKGETTKNPVLNFGGQNHELWCTGGERKFIQELIRQSKKFPESCFWYSTLVSKQSNLKPILRLLDDAKAHTVHTIPMGQGNKTSRIVTWTFLTKQQQKDWKNTRWKKP